MPRYERFARETPEVFQSYDRGAHRIDEAVNQAAVELMRPQMRMRVVHGIDELAERINMALEYESDSVIRSDLMSFVEQGMALVEKLQNS